MTEAGVAVRAEPAWIPVCAPARKASASAMDEVDFMDEIDGNETDQAGEGQSRHVTTYSCGSTVFSRFMRYHDGSLTGIRLIVLGL